MLSSIPDCPGNRQVRANTAVRARDSDNIGRNEIRKSSRP